MDHVLSKITSVILLLIFNSSFANAGHYVDTTILLANSKTEISSTVFIRTIVKEANISYPQSFKAHRDQSLEYVQKFSEQKRSYLIRTQQRGKKIFPKVSAVLKRYNLPQELRVLIALESGFNPNAISSAGAVGYWQFMDAAAKEYGLKIIEAKDTAAARFKLKDDRTNFTKSTYAAAKYLRDRSKNLNNNLLLMVASYNCGIGNVWQAMKKSGKSNPDFWDIKKHLPAETRSYVMNFIALNVVFSNYDAFLKRNMVFKPEYVDVPEVLIKLNTSSTD